MCSWCIYLLAARQDFENHHREEENERWELKKIQFMRVAKLSWLLSFCSNHFTKGILWRDNWKLINCRVRVWQLIGYDTNNGASQELPDLKVMIELQIFFFFLLAS